MTSTEELGHQITRCIADAVSGVLGLVAGYCGEQVATAIAEHGAEEPEPPHRHEWTRIEILDPPERGLRGLPPLVLYKCACLSGWLPSSTEQPDHLRTLQERINQALASYDRAK